MRTVSYPLALLFLFLISCTTSTEEKELTEREKAVRDSVSKIEQRKKSDSLKKTNPLLIVPPDSNYTGSYVDKYDNGITKFKGFFRFGKRHGQWVSFYPDGLMWSELHFDKGLRHGPNLTYYQNGELRYSGFYKNDKRDSLWVYYDSVGKVAQKFVFKEDKVMETLPPK